MDLISIIMPARNAGLFIQECLDSIVNQEYKNWELLIIDDHSTDDTLNIASEYQQSDNRIKVFNNVEKGIIPALSCGFNHSSGTFITRMDADDVMSPNKLKLFYSALTEAGEGHVVTGLVKYIENETLGKGFKKYANWLNKLTIASSNYSQIYKECVIPSPNWMMYKSDLIKCGRLVQSLYPEDYDLCFRMYKEGIKVVGINEITHLWRDHPSRASRMDENYRDQLFYELKWSYFLQLDRDTKRKLVLWGAGRKAKELAKLIMESYDEFSWVCENNRKIGRDIYGITLEDCNELLNLKEHQIVVAVSAPKGQKEILNYLESKELILNKDYYIFC